MVPRILTNVDWYMMSNAFVQQYRELKVRKEERIDEGHLMQLRIEMSPVIVELDKIAENGTHHFLEHIYKTHPPRKENATMGSLDTDQMSPTVKKALSHYHPDVQSNETDDKWEFLCTEITKILNLKYTVLDD